MVQTYLSFKLDTRRKRKDGTFPIVMRLSYNGDTRYITTGKSCCTNEWNSRSSTVNKLHPYASTINEHLKEQLERYRGIIAELKTEHISNIGQLKDTLAGRVVAPQTVNEFWHQEIERLKLAGKHGNARNYLSALGGIKKHKDLNIHFELIDYNWLIKLETSLLHSVSLQTKVNFSGS
ncbi:MAG: hypothetical protein H6599_03765 [Flavobacteriales bacterium]|nr:hypothetical protein [Flavobacteriales bacterium]